MDTIRLAAFSLQEHTRDNLPRLLTRGLRSVHSRTLYVYCMNIPVSLRLALHRIMATESAKTNGSLPAHYLQRYNEDSFLFTSESVGEGHPGE